MTASANAEAMGGGGGAVGQAVTASADALTAQVAAAYDGTGAAWEEAPARLVYDRLADALVELSPVPLAGRVVLDVGAGTGAAGRSIARAGGHPVATDISSGMLRANVGCRNRAVVGDAVALPVASAAVDGLVAAFSFSHVVEPAAAFREAARVCRPGSPLLAATYAEDDHHPAKEAVNLALAEAGWRSEPWCDELRAAVMPVLATVDGMAGAAHAGGLHGSVRRLTVEIAGLTPDELVAWRVGMAQAAPFVAGLDPMAHARLLDRARALLGDDPPRLRRPLVVFVGLTP